MLPRSALPSIFESVNDSGWMTVFWSGDISVHLVP
jgi:hypothetical protein